MCGSSLRWLAGRAVLTAQGNGQVRSARGRPVISF
jgi:hypothetical protein